MQIKMIFKIIKKNKLNNNFVLGNNFFEVTMKQNWTDEQIKALFDLIEKNSNENIPLIKSFDEFAKTCGKNKLTIRNFYYSFVKILKQNTVLCNRLGIDLSNHNVQHFEHFDAVEEKELLNKIEQDVKGGMSVREACQKLSNGDIKKMLRLQNKYQAYKSKCKVLKFPMKNVQAQKEKLSDSEINSLFLGLVKLVKEQAFGESEQKVKNFLEYSSEERRKQLVANQEKQNEIDRLKQLVLKLKQKNRDLNLKLQTYRIDYVANQPKPNGNNI